MAEVGGDQGEKAEEGKKASETTAATLLKQGGEKLVPLIVSGASLIGFVAFAGAVIVWTRFQAIGVPGDQAVKAVPQDELVATGSSLLLLFGFFGLLAVLAAFLVDRGGRPTPGIARALLLVVAVEGTVAVVLVEEVSAIAKDAVCIAFLLLVGLVFIATFDSRFATYKDWLRNRGRESGKAQLGPDSLYTDKGKLRLPIWIPALGLAAVAAAAGFVAILMELGPTGVGLIAVLLYLVGASLAIPALAWGAANEIRANRKAEDARHKREREAEEAGIVGFFRKLWRGTEDLRDRRSEEEIAKAEEAERLRKRRPHRLVLTPLGAGLLTALAVVAIVVPAVILHAWWLAAAFGAAFALGAGVWRVAVLPKARFVWFGLAAFLSVPLFGTCALMARNFDDPQVQPLALIRATDGPGESIEGIYVTEASERIYFANVATRGCENELVPDSGRLLWVPKKEVVAMSVGPLQNVNDVGRSALEMGYELTPNVETPSGEGFSLAVAHGAEEDESKAKGRNKKAKDEKKKGEEGEKSDAAENSDAAAEEEAETDGHRLESAGPAVRPFYGTGLKLIPSSAEAGDVVELRMSDVDDQVEGFGQTPAGHDLRLNGVRLAVLRVPALDPERAEYVKTVGNRILPLVGSFRIDGEEFVRVDSESVHDVTDGNSRGNFTLEVTAEGRLAPRVEGKKIVKEMPPRVTLPNGDVEDLRYVLLRRDWSPNRIRFRVPDNATSGIVSVDCGQLAGQPVLAVVEPPVARIAVRMRPDSNRVVFDSRHSTAAERGRLIRHWTIAGRHTARKRQKGVALPPRMAPYSASLTIVDRASGLSDTVTVRLLRFPSSPLELRRGSPKGEATLRRVRYALGAAVDRAKPAAVELYGHADVPRKDSDRASNAQRSFRGAERLRALLFAAAEAGASPEGDPGGLPASAAEPRLALRVPPVDHGGASIPMTVRSMGKSCPIVRAPGAQPVNSGVEVFLLGPGASVATARGCHVERTRRTSW